MYKYISIIENPEFELLEGILMSNMILFEKVYYNLGLNYLYFFLYLNKKYCLYKYNLNNFLQFLKGFYYLEIKE